jgi:hypothetical protein
MGGSGGMTHQLELLKNTVSSMEPADKMSTGTARATGVNALALDRPKHSLSFMKAPEWRAFSAGVCKACEDVIQQLRLQHPVTTPAARKTPEPAGAEQPAVSTGKRLGLQSKLVYVPIPMEEL